VCCFDNWCWDSPKFIFFREIAKIFHQSFKDGTDGTSDRRWFAGVYLALRMAIVSSVLWRSEQDIQVIASVSGLLLVAVFQPHVISAYNCIDALLFGGLAVISVLMTASQSKHIAQILIFLIPMVVIIILSCWRCKGKVAKSLATPYDQIKKRVSRYRCPCEATQEDDDQKPLLDQPQPINISHTVVDIQT
jgi:hypothetical protein